MWQRLCVWVGAVVAVAAAVVVAMVVAVALAGAQAMGVGLAVNRFRVYGWGFRTRREFLKRHLLRFKYNMNRGLGFRV